MLTKGGTRFGTRVCLVALVSVSPLASSRLVEAQIAITRWTVDGGGTGFVQVVPFVLGGTIGQPDAGRVTDGQPRTPTTIVGGFWVPSGPIPVGVEDTGDGTAPILQPFEFAIRRAAPNPLNARTTIAFDLPAPTEASVEVFDVTGALVRTLASQSMPAGRHTVDWDATDQEGRRARAGLYWVRIRAGGLERTQKLVVLQ